MKKLAALVLAAAMALAMGTAASAAVRTSESREVLELVNKEREAAGLSALVWEQNLEDYANTRAQELTVKLSHTRPNGEKAMNYNRGIDAENIGTGQSSASQVVQAWMNSSGHRQNIMNPKYVSMAAAYAVDEGGNYYWVQLFSSDRQRAAVNGSGDSEADSGASSSAAPAPAAAAGAVSAQAVLDAFGASTGATATAKVQNRSTVTQDTLKQMAGWSSRTGRSAVLVADTLGADGKVSARVSIGAAAYGSFGGDFSLGVHVTGTQVDNHKAFVGKWYQNRAAVVYMDQAGSFPPVRVAAKVDLSGMNTAALVFYNYDGADNRFVRIENPEYIVDQNGFVSFNTARGGAVIITEGALAKR